MKLKAHLLALCLLVICSCAFPIAGANASAGDDNLPALRERVLCPTGSDEARQLYNNGLDLTVKGDLEAAAKSYLKALELDGNYCDAMDNLGQLLRRQGKLDQAIYWYKRSIAVLPDNRAAHINLAVAYSANGNEGAAVSQYRFLIKMDPNDPEGYYGLGTVYLTSKKFDLAVKNFKKAERLYSKSDSPLVADARYALGMTWFNLKDYKKSREYLEKIYSLKQNDPRINYILGLCYLEEKDGHGQAVKYLQKARQLGAQIPPELLREVGL